MAIIAGTMLVLVTLYLVIRPFFSQEKLWETERIEDDLDDVTLTGIYATMNELDMEYEMGKLAEDDYRSMKRNYEALAIEELRKQEQADDGVEETTDDVFEAEIERELEEMRKAREQS
ncbi:hypothetical protein [Salisediminibacterium selenitireducens]|uniref:C-type cytochrome biogenesis protein CcmI n=1 Tax=Bacillus selenitireducens (strain ATCC 700615 / DSM 15326 / MLS10) TaxID=439292 RepID=D6XSN7_BACIE|nr:hypothetical protein [Salisediminibacterium selenitireducens]ADH98823.1 hypothetical protein Bsel_1311 [[Bacillus] selenitireducens MLS10]